jgi:hypothetical protein
VLETYFAKKDGLPLPPIVPQPAPAEPTPDPDSPPMLPPTIVADDDVFPLAPEVVAP